MLSLLHVRVGRSCCLQPLAVPLTASYGQSKPGPAACLRAVPAHIRKMPCTVQELLDSLDADLRYVIEVEGKLSMEDVENYDEVRAEIVRGLEDLRDVPNRRENPLIYHLDVAAMYPNIILTNR